MEIKRLITVLSIVFINGFTYAQGLMNNRNQILDFEKSRAELIITNDSMIISKIKIPNGVNSPLEENKYKFDNLYKGEFYDTPSEITYKYSNTKINSAKSKFDEDIKLLEKLNIPFTLNENTLKYVSKKGSTVVTFAMKESKSTKKADVIEEVYTRVRSIGKIEKGASKYDIAYAVFKNEIYDEENYGPGGNEFEVDWTPTYLKEDDTIEFFGEHGGFIVYIKNGIAIAAVSEYKDGPEILFYDESYHDFLKDIEYDVFAGPTITLGLIFEKNKNR